MRDRDDERLVVNGAGISFPRDPAVFRCEKLNRGATATLRKPDLSHRRKLKFAHEDFGALAEIERAGNGIDAHGGARDNGNFIGCRTDEMGEGGARGFILFDPAVPRGTVFVPRANVFENQAFYSVAECSLRTGVQVYLVPENGKSRTSGCNVKKYGQWRDLWMK